VVSELAGRREKRFHSTTGGKGLDVFSVAQSSVSIIKASSDFSSKAVYRKQFLA